MFHLIKKKQNKKIKTLEHDFTYTVSTKIKKKQNSVPNIGLISLKKTYQCLNKCRIKLQVFLLLDIFLNTSLSTAVKGTNRLNYYLYEKKN